MTPIPETQIRRIFIRAANWVGDAVMSTPMIRAVRRRFPTARMVILAKPWVAPVFEGSPDLDEIMIYDAAGRHSGVPGILRLSREVAARRFDLAVLVQNAFEAALIARLANIPRRLGYIADGRGALLTHGVPRTRAMKRRHQIDYYLGITEAAGIPTCGRDMTLRILPRERAAADRILAEQGISDRHPLLGVNPGAAFGSAKRWPVNRFGELCRRLRAAIPELQVAVFGGPGEEKLGEAVRVLAGQGAVNLAGRTSLRMAMALIERCRLFVTNDSGLMHVAAALAVPQIAVFGSTDHTTTSPAHRDSRMIRVPVPCSPCMKPECPLGHHQCMRAVTVERVMPLALRMLGRSAT